MPFTDKYEIMDNFNETDPTVLKTVERYGYKTCRCRRCDHERLHLQRTVHEWRKIGNRRWYKTSPQTPQNNAPYKPPQNHAIYVFNIYCIPV